VDDDLRRGPGDGTVNRLLVEAVHEYGTCAELLEVGLLVRVPGGGDDLVAGSEELRHQPPSENAGSTGEKDAHALETWPTASDVTAPANY
jgi:hypothetical protein